MWSGTFRSWRGCPLSSKRNSHYIELNTLEAKLSNCSLATFTNVID